MHPAPYPACVQTAEDSVAGRGQSPHKARAGLRHLLTNPGFFRLLGVKVTAQWGDGVFQAGLGSAVLFNPSARPIHWPRPPGSR